MISYNFYEVIGYFNPMLTQTSGDVEQARVLVYSIAWCGYLPLGPCLMTIAGVWPLVLSPTFNNQPIVDVLFFMLRSTYLKEPHILSKVLRKITF